MSILKANSNAEILSYIINETPELKEEIDLPVQGESVKPIGKIIMDNERYKNAFINTINLIGLTVIKENRWNNPWQSFTDKGMLRFGQQIREIIQDLAHVFDYNKNYSKKEKFLETAVPDVYQYIHEINFQKVWETTVNESALLMAFDDEENGLLKFIEETISNLYETYDYDKWLVDKYQIMRRALDGTITSVQITETDPRDIIARMKGVSNRMLFKKRNYNPAGIRRATPFKDQYLMLDADREAITATNVLATSFFRNDAEVKTNLALIDSYTEEDEDRLAVLLEEAYIPFTDEEKEQLASILGFLFARDFFMDYHRALDTNPEVNGKRQTEWVNPTTLDRNIFLHAQEVISTSPFANACLFTTIKPEVTSIAITPSTATVTKGQKLPLKAIVTTQGFANKAAYYSVDSASATDKVTIDRATGELYIPSTATVQSVTVTATSVFDSTKTATATITVSDGTVPSITSVTVTAAGSATSITKGSTLQLSATVVKTGNASTGVTWELDEGATGFTVSSNGLVTAPAETSVESITVTATSIFDTTKSDDITLTVAAAAQQNNSNRSTK